MWSSTGKRLSGSCTLAEINWLWSVFYFGICFFIVVVSFLFFDCCLLSGCAQEPHAVCSDPLTVFLCDLNFSSFHISPGLFLFILFNLCCKKNGDCQPLRSLSLSLSPSVSLLQFVCLILYLAMCCNAVGVVCHSRFLPLVLVVCAECICSSVSPVSAVLVHFALLQFCHCVMVDWSDCTSPVPCNHPLCHLCCNTF